MQDPDAPLCPVCQYRLVGLPASGRCPECGCDYDPHLVAVGSLRPPGGWLVLLTVPAAAALAAAGLTYLGGPVGLLGVVLLAGWCWVVGRRVGVWQYEVRAKAHLRGERPKPPPYFRRAVAQVIFAGAILLMYLVWAVMQ